MSDECNHDAARVEHQEQVGTEVEFWIATATIRAVDAIDDRDPLRGVVFVDSWL